MAFFCIVLPFAPPTGGGGNVPQFAPLRKPGIHFFRWPPFRERRFDAERGKTRVADGKTNDMTTLTIMQARSGLADALNRQVCH